MTAIASKHDSGKLVANGRTVEYHVKTSNTAKLLRIRVGPRGIEVVRPKGKTSQEAKGFVDENARWVSEQLERIDRLKVIQRPKWTQSGILLQGQPTPVVVVLDPSRRGPNRVERQGDQLRVLCGPSGIEPERSLEHWLRREARAQITRLVGEYTRRVRRHPARIYIMDQRTKWGNCSALGNLSFSWRLVLAPLFVMHYLVAHEVVHLAVPDHSKRFWLTLQSLCKDTDRARQWLCANENELRNYLDARWHMK